MYTLSQSKPLELGSSFHICEIAGGSYLFIPELEPENVPVNTNQ